MKKKLLVIFFLCTLCSYLIYKSTFDNRIYISVLGDNSLFFSESKGYDIYLSEYLIKKHKLKNIDKSFTTYKEKYRNILTSIRTNKTIIQKGKEVSINFVIKNSNYIIFNMNNNSFMDKCNKSKNIIKSYIDNNYKELEDLLKVIEKICNAKIIIIGNYCIDYYPWLDKYLMDKNSKYIYINLYKAINNNINLTNYDKNYTLTNEGQYYIFNELIKVLN